MSGSFQALRKANPRAKEDFAETVAAASALVRARLGDASVPLRAPRQRRLLGVSALGASLAAAAAVVTFLTVGSPGGGPGVADAEAAFKRAATVTAASAERSGTAVVRIHHDGELWAGTTLRWHGNDLAMSSDAPRHPKRPRGRLLVVDGIVYGIEPGLGWVAMGSPKNIDPDSGTTPDEYLAAVREDVGGVTLRRITDGMTGLTTTELADGSTVYRGSVAAGLIARETGFKEGQALRVLPFGYVAHDEAADPAALLDVAVTVGAGGTVSDVTVSWGTWVYRVAYSRLGTSPALVAPRHAPSLLELRAQAR